MINCLLCNSTNTVKIGEISSSKIVKKYLKYFKADFSYLFKDKKIELINCKSCDLRFYMPLVTGDEHFYSVLQKTKYYYRENKEEYDLAAKIIPAGVNILDVGCGNGEFKKFVPESNFTGLEFSKTAMEEGIKNGYNILNQSIEEHSKLYPGKYDFVTAFQVLEHVPNVAEFLVSCAKCVKPGGNLIIAVPSEESYLHFSVNSILNMPPHHISRWSDKALTSITDLINFTLVQISHDKLDELHLDSYFSTLIENCLPFKNRSTIKLIDNSLNHKIRMKLASLLAKNISKNRSHEAWLGNGQNVTVIYQRPY